jgi:hypothetical protein
MRLSALPALLSVVLGGGCAAKPTREENDARAMRTFQIARVRDVDPAFAAAGRCLVDGFPESLDDDGFWPGDRLLFGVESFDGTAVERFYLLFECVAPATRRGEVELVTHDGHGEVTHRANVPTEFAAVKVTLLDEQRQELRSAVSEVARAAHEIGTFPYALAYRARERGRLPRTLATARTRRSAELMLPDWGEAIAGCLRRELMDNAAMAYLASRLSIMPGWFEAIGFLGQQMTLNYGMHQPVLVPQPIGGLPAGEDALECATSICGDQLILVVNVVMVPAVGPLAMSAGFVTLTGYRAQEPDRHFVMRLLGAARGEKPRP